MKSRLFSSINDHPIELKIAYFQPIFIFWPCFAPFCIIFAKNSNLSMDFAKMCTELHTCINCRLWKSLVLVKWLFLLSVTCNRILGLRKCSTFPLTKKRVPWLHIEEIRKTRRTRWESLKCPRDVSFETIFKI